MNVTEQVGRVVRELQTLFQAARALPPGKLSTFTEEWRRTAQVLQVAKTKPGDRTAVRTAVASLGGLIIAARTAGLTEHVLAPILAASRALTAESNALFVDPPPPPPQPARATIHLRTSRGRVT